MSKPTLREQIAEAFRIARKEGALTRFADGKSDAEDVCWWFKEELEGLKIDDIELLKATSETPLIAGSRWQSQKLRKYRAIVSYTIKELKEKMG